MMNKYIGGKKYKININYYIMCIINMLQGLVFYGPIATIYREERGLTLKEILIIESVLLITILIFEIPWGIFADKFGYKNTIIISTGILFLSKIIFYNSYSINMFLIQAVLSGISMAGISGCDYAMIFESIAIEKSEKVFGTYQAFGTFGFFIASIGSSILSRYSLNTTVLATILAYGISFILTWFLVPINNKEPNKKNENGNIINIIKNINIHNKNFIGFICLIISLYLIYEVSHSIEVYLSQLQYVRSNINYIFFGIINSITQLLCMLSAKTYLITKKLGQVKTIILFVSIMFVSNFILIFNNSGGISIALIMIIQISMAILSPIVADIENKSIDDKSNNRATILSIYSMISSLIATFVNIIIGTYSNNSVEKAFKMCFFIMIISFIGIFICSKYKNKITL